MKQSEFNTLNNVTTRDDALLLPLGTKFLFMNTQSYKAAKDIALRHKIVYYIRDDSDIGYRPVFDILESDEFVEIKVEFRPGIERNPTRDDDDKRYIKSWKRWRRRSSSSSSISSTNSSTSSSSSSLSSSLSSSSRSSSSSSNVVWFSYLSNEYWVPSGDYLPDGATWEEGLSRWKAYNGGGNGRYITLAPTGSWYKGFRPTKVRITHTFPTTAGELTIYGYEDCDLVYDGGYISEMEVPINSAGDCPSGSDIKRFDMFSYVTNPSKDLYITNIEFYMEYSSSSSSSSNSSSNIE
jgi:hypothetical protein